MAVYSIREAAVADVRVLTDMMVEAANWNAVAPRPRSAVLADAQHTRYVHGWRRPGDAGVVAVGQDGAPVGACWYRLFPSDAPGFGYVAGGVPELILGVSPIHRAQGVGRQLLRATVQLARAAGYQRISLSVERANHAVSLYRTEGFATVDRRGTRDTMVLNLR
ncbi:Acetyltransferase (GNAT) family protein [Plantibacter flavus]|jgi:GNAT superfamily N-acetyltransferase|uniref:Acetyltransferase (GNAT) family protein n=1 Tax=Plantibacter flavus TaxID=150123 RepID=A0A3N2C3R3_9MICO|nr:GNAT family N-acetyltransferase [Plantibacter flavus]ROR82167.1 acetyltransferase (GNAT) family protein [Plantibacter flavus]SMG42080.1 Acetyltransferase (GNAT) family protein [Plantibacter flavus]